MRINNPKKKCIYYNKSSGLLHDSIWEFLSIDKIRKFDLAAHQVNTTIFIDRPDRYRETIPGLVPIPPQSNWYYDGNNFISMNERTIDNVNDVSFDQLLEVCKRLIKSLDEKTVGVELSGGLDTAIITGLLKKYGITPVLIGMTNDRYEFRTESTIQKIYQKEFKNTFLLDHNDYLPFSSLKNTPVHQLPSTTSLFHAMWTKFSAVCKENGVQILFNGSGMDALLGDNPIQNDRQKYPEAWQPWMLSNSWIHEYVFCPKGITYAPAASSLPLILIICQLRRQAGEDHRKLWARKMFADLIPKELSCYSYKGDFVGLLIDGLMASKKDIEEIFKVAYDITRFKELSINSLNKYFGNLKHYNDEEENLIRSRLSFANWVYGLISNNLIK